MITIASRGTTQQSSAPYNRRIVLDVIRRRGSVQRKEIVEAVSLSPQTVANITRDLESIGLIVSRRLRGEGSRGQPPITFELNPDGGSSIGISVWPGGASAALINLVGDVIARREVEFDARKQRQVLSSMMDVVTDLAARRSSASGRPWGVGVALPGPLASTDISFVGPTTLEGWTDLSILDELRDLTGLQVYYSVDSVAGALGEALFGVAQSFDNFFYLHFATGLGGTLVVNRSPYKGTNGNANEIGHIPVSPDGKLCYCGNRGCLERYLSLHSLSEALGLHINELRDHGKETLARMLDTGDPQLLAWCRQAAQCLQNAVCTIENMLDPQTIVIGGSAPRALVERLIALAEPLHKSVRGGVAHSGARILLSERQEDSPILGAAVMPIHEMLSPRFEVLLKDRRPDLKVAGLLGQRPNTRADRL